MARDCATIDIEEVKQLAAEIPREIGRKIRTIRQSQEMSQSELAHRSGLHQQAIARAEICGVKHIDVIYRIAHALGVQAASLIF